MSQSCHCEAPQGPWQSRRTVLNFRKISANSKHFTGDSHVASLLGMTKRRLFAIPRIPRCFPLVFPPKPPAGQLFRQPVSQKRNVPPGKPDGTFRRKERKREKKEKKHEKERGCDLWKTSDQGRGLSCSDGSSALADVVGSSFCTASSLLSNTMGRRNVLP